MTEGATKEDAQTAMSDALGAALAGYVQDGRELPTPSRQKRGECLVPVSPLVAAKLALRTAMLKEGITNVRLASLLEVSEGAVRRLVNPDHASKLEGIIQALQVIGRQLVVEDIESEIT